MSQQQSIQKVETALAALQKGRGVILTDDAHRENEGDLIFSSEHITQNQIAQLIRDCSGIICLCITEEKARQLQLPMMVTENKSPYQTAFTVSIEAREGVSTGVSAKDRWQTIKTAAKMNALAEELISPGHVFPLVAKNGGVLERRGHTEGSVDLMMLSGLQPSAVLCELMLPDGTMMKGEALVHYQKQHDLCMLSVEDMVTYRSAHVAMTKAKCA